MKAVVGAQRALAGGEFGARYALRQSLVDLAAWPLGGEST
jgi:hypothetical protein